MTRAGILCIALAGCLHQPEEPGVLGSRSDVTTAPGNYTGYRVVTACPTTFASVGVVGTGTIAVTQVAQISEVGQQLQREISDISSIWGWGGYGLVCEPGVGTEIDLDDWRDVDMVIDRVGAFLHAHDYALQVGITVGSIPVAVAQ